MAGMPGQTSSPPSGRTTVALVQSRVRDASRFDYPEIRRVVREAVRLAGGLGGIVRDGHTVVLKPNIVATRGNAGWTFLDFDAYRPALKIPKEVNGITTDYRVAKAVVELVREVNPSGRVYIMEGSAWGSTARNLELMGYDHRRIPGVDRFISLDDTSRFSSVDSDDLVAVDPGVRRRYPPSRMPHGTGGLYYLDRTYFEADALISIPVLKNHLYAGMSGGIKNVAIGATPPALYGKSRNRIARIRKIDHSWGPLQDWIHDYYLCRPVDFVVTDGLQGSQFGPRAQGTWRVDRARMNMRLVLAGRDAVAVDTVHSCIVGTDPEKVDHLRNLAAGGAGVTDTRRIHVRGNRRVDEVRRDFKLNRIFGLIYRGRAAKYTDFKEPGFEVVGVAATGGVLAVKTRPSPRTAKMEVFLDGEMRKVFVDGFDHLEIPVDGVPPDGPGEVAIHAYDRFLSCARRTVDPGKWRREDRK